MQLRPFLCYINNVERALVSYGVEMKRLMIIDALNAYFRAYIVDPSLSPTGNPIGGYKGFIKILQKFVGR